MRNKPLGEPHPPAMGRSQRPAQGRALPLPLSAGLARSGRANLEKSLTVLKPGGLAISVVGPPDASFAKQLGAPSFPDVAMNTPSHKIRMQAKALGALYQFFFMQANGSKLCKLGALYGSGKRRPAIDCKAMVYVEQGLTNVGKAVVSMAPDNV
ncbi:hypothetical protein ACTU45_24035 [Streptomyces sp. 24-1644]|uniref:hypothetical protein n=1 Tax=Streptomyces sp. 24-1644 TaxID=3457315 RepID=UPI003FA7A083